MAEQRKQDERPRPHGDPLEHAMGEGPTADLIEQNPDDNAAQRQSDAQPDATLSGDLTEDPSERSDRAHGQGSTANGVPAFDEDDGQRRRRQYDEGAGIVSRID